jgi:glycosyl hydrolase family 18 (putative chitinase)
MLPGTVHPRVRHARIAARPVGRLAGIGLALVLVGGSVVTASPAAAAQASGPAVSARPGPARLAVDPGIRPLVTQIRPLTNIVYGYLPYWRLDAGTAGRLQYDLLSTIAFFGLGIAADGSIGMTAAGAKAYVSDDAIAVTNAAHAAGVRVVPTFQLFDGGGLYKMTAFLGSTTAQNRFIALALDLMVRRSADGANIDFEPLPESQAPGFLAFVDRFGKAMRARIPGAQLVVATSAGAGETLVAGLVPLVDQMFVMTYNYRWSGSTIAGAMAPLDNTVRTVKLHISRYLTRAPASKIIMGIGYYGYDWPVTRPVANATVQANRTAHGGVWSVTYSSIRAWLATHPAIVRHEDTLEGSGWFTYYDTASTSYREVYFEDEFSVAAKDDYAIASGLAGVGIWTLGGDGVYPELWDVLRAKFFAPAHQMTMRAAARNVALADGRVTLDIWQSVRNSGNIPERGTVTWVVRDSRGLAHAHGSRGVTLYPGGSTSFMVHAARIGSASGLRAGTYTVTLTFVGAGVRIAGAPVRFRQPF